MAEIKIYSDWKNLLIDEFNKDYMQNLKQFLIKEKQTGKIVFPPNNKIFNMLNLTSFVNTKVIILGQDPYHGFGQAHGLSFSVEDGIKFPPSLKNIFLELKNDLGYDIPLNGNLTKWASQGILMLNSVLTVRQKEPTSHAGRGWERFTNYIIHYLAENKVNLCFLLWGSYAQKKADFINQDKHLIIKTSHPSPFSASRGFFGSKPFSKINNYLTKQRIQSIDWEL